MYTTANRFTTLNWHLMQNAPVEFRVKGVKEPRGGSKTAPHTWGVNSIKTQTTALPERSCRTRSWSRQLWTPAWGQRWSCSRSSAFSTQLDQWEGCHSQLPANGREGHRTDSKHTQSCVCKHTKQAACCRWMIDLAMATWSDPQVLQRSVRLSSGF